MKPMMESTMILLNAAMKEYCPDTYTVTVDLSAGVANLPNRALFMRAVYRQSTIDEYGDFDVDEEPVAQPLHLVYTVHPKGLEQAVILSLLESMKNDLNDYVFKNR